MKTKIILTALALAIMVSAFGQKPTLELTFTAIDSTAYVQLDSIKVMNRTQGGDTVLYYPDTVLTLYYVGIHENQDVEGNFRVMQNFPNPVVYQTTISIYVPERDNVSLRITDILGRQLITTERFLNKGYHSFRFTPGSQELYFFNASWRGINQYIKIISSGAGSGRSCRLKYQGCDVNTVAPLKSVTAFRNFSYILGDELLYIGYLDTLESGRLDKPEASQTYTFQFATNIPCPGTPTMEYEGQVYNTIQIFSQCWLKENLNVGTMIQGVEEMTDNDIMEKYCYNNEPDSCTKYGGLYQWDEMMQYTTIRGTQGICPVDWHLPTDEEWKVLEGAVDSQYGIGDPEWDPHWNERGYDAGINLESISGWFGGGIGTDMYGYSGLPGGYRYEKSNFYALSFHSFWWTSSKYNYYGTWFAWFRNVNYIGMGVYLDFGLGINGFSVRCIRDY
jgi:uncharacterized protein (TIGR02145 family)